MRTGVSAFRPYRVIGEPKDLHDAGFYTSEHFNRDYPRIQILTIEDLFDGKEVKMPGEAMSLKKGSKNTPTTPNQALPGF